MRMLSEKELLAHRELCETMLSNLFNPSESLKLEIQFYLARINRELNKRHARRNHPAGKGLK